MLLKCLCLILSITLIQGRQGYGPGEQDWGYEEVRPHAHMFWWLHHTTADETVAKAPLLIWLQGGPGASSSGEGNIYMSGPVDEHLNPRNFSFVQLAHVLYVDNPVGAGYSYVDTEQGGTFAANIDDIAKDFVHLLRGFLKEHAAFCGRDLYLYGESFGGKMAPAIAELILEIGTGDLDIKLQGVALAYPAVSLLDTVEQIPPTLLYAGVVDNVGHDKLNSRCLSIKEAAEDDRWEEAGYQLDSFLDHVIATYNLDFMNIIANNADANGMQELNNFMNTYVSPVLNITTQFGVQRDIIPRKMIDRLKSTTNSVANLLNNGVKVAILSGQLDWVVNPRGTYNWVANMDWNYKDSWNRVTPEAYFVNGIKEGDVKTSGKLAYYTVKRAGHKLPNHNPQATKYILEQLINKVH